MPLELKKPLIVFDVESTGLNTVSDRIIELSYVKLWPNGKRDEHTYRFNPECPIPKESQAVHHITDADVAGEPVFKQRAREIANIFEGCDIAGFNSNHFDIPILMEEMLRAGVPFSMDGRRFIDVQAIYHKKERRDLEAAYRFYCGKEMDNHHNAMCDTRTTLEVLLAQVDHYADLPSDVPGLADFSQHNRNVDLAARMIYNDKGEETFNFGKYKGKTVVEVLRTDPSYYAWFMRSDFPLDSKNHLTRIKLRMAAK